MKWGEQVPVLDAFLADRRRLLIEPTPEFEAEPLEVQAYVLETTKDLSE